MKMKLDTDDVIENLIAATLGADASARQKHVFRESLHSLVRLAKVEQLTEIKASVSKLTGTPAIFPARRRTKSAQLASSLQGGFHYGQQQFEFKQ